LTEDHWKKTITRSIRFSPALRDMIKVECEYRGIDFSQYIRYAATAAMKHGNRVVRGDATESETHFA
jgi:hypothetical protein